MTAPAPPAAVPGAAADPGVASPADEPRWQGMTHQEIYRMVTDGPGAAGSAGAERAWRSAAATLAALHTDLGGQARTLPAGWEGDAADGAQGGLSRLADWAGRAADGARRTADGLGAQAGLAADLRARMPLPAGAAPPDVAPAGPADPSLLADWAAADTSAGNGAQRAVELMQRYSEDSRVVGESFGGWGPPPAVAVVVAAGGAGTGGPGMGVSTSVPGATGGTAPPPSGSAGGSVGGIAAGAAGATAGVVTGGAAASGRRSAAPVADARPGARSAHSSGTTAGPAAATARATPGAATRPSTTGGASGASTPRAASGTSTSGATSGPDPSGSVSPGSAGTTTGATSSPGAGSGAVTSGAAHRPPSGRHLTSGQRGQSGPTGGTGAGRSTDRTRRSTKDGVPDGSARRVPETDPAPVGAGHLASDGGSAVPDPGAGSIGATGTGGGHAAAALSTTAPGGHTDVGAAPVVQEHGHGTPAGAGAGPPQPGAGGAGTTAGAGPGTPGTGDHATPVTPMAPGVGAAPGSTGQVTRPPAWRALVGRHAAAAGAEDGVGGPCPGGAGAGSAPGHVRPVGPPSGQDGAETLDTEHSDPAAPPVLRPENPWRHHG